MSTIPKLMGILNITPDSFFDGGQYAYFDSAIQQGEKLCAEGADWIDIGGESTRPGAEFVEVSRELERVIPVIKALKSKMTTPISIDTYKAPVAAAAIEAGAEMINDITGFTDPAMQDLAASTQAAICVMHMQGSPQTMQHNPIYPEPITDFLLKWFDKQLNLLLKKGVQKEKIWIDPGIGFGKTVAHNLEILQNLPQLGGLGFPLLLGVSRKSFMSKILNKPSKDLLPATLAVNAASLIRADVGMIRVHDVQQHRDLIDLMAVLKKGKWEWNPCKLG